MNATLKFGFTLFVFFAAGLAQAAPCKFIDRAEISEYMSELAPNVIGWVSCDSKAPEASVFIVAKFDALDEKSLATFVTSHARLMDHSSTSAEISWQSKQPLAKRQMIVTTRGKKIQDLPQDSMSHYAFVTTTVGGPQLVFIHSLDDRQARLIRGTLDNLRVEITQSAFTNRIISSTLVAR